MKFEHKQSGLEGDISLYNTLVRACLSRTSRTSSSFICLLMFAGSAQHPDAGHVRSPGPTRAVPGLHHEGVCKGVDHHQQLLLTGSDPHTNLILTPVSAQRCDIGDASRGSLSSYAYILMVLYFLQQRQPPVIPVLQEVGSSFVCKPPCVDVDGTFLMVSHLFYFDKALDSVTLSVQTQSDPRREQS